ncbi:MAG: sugar ABC transporter substrate-binding protein [Oscillospiraceae bacterium]
MKKAVSFLLALTLILSVFAGCGSAGTPAAGESAAADPNKQITLEVAVSGSAQELAIHQQKFDLFTKAHPNVTIKPIDIGTERVQKTMTLIGAGSAPDILYLNEWTYVFANKGVIKELDGYIEKEKFDTTIFPESLMVPLRYEGKTYAFPQEISPYVVYYNKDLFKKAGLPMPTDDWTIDEFYSAAKALTNPAEKVYGFRQTTWADTLLGWISRAGVEYDISGKEVKGLDTPEALNALKFLYKMVITDKVSPNPADLQAMGKGSDAMFRNQKSAMETAGLWMLPTYKADPLPFEWDVVKMPKDMNQKTKAGILNWGISKDSKNPDMAWELLKFLCGPEGMKIVAESNMALPGSNDKASNQIVIDSKFPNNVEAFIKAVPDVDFLDQLSVYRTEVNTCLQKVVEEMLIGKRSPEDTQKELVKQINAILAQ